MNEVQILQQKVFTRRQFESIPAAIRRLLVVEEKRIGRLTVYVVRGVLPEPPPRPRRRRGGKIAKLAEAVEAMLRERGCVRTSDFDGASRTVYLAIRSVRERLGLVYVHPYWCLPGRLPPVAAARRAVAPDDVLREASTLCRTGRFKLRHLLRRLQLPAAAAPAVAALLLKAGFRREERWYLCPESPSFSAPGRRLRRKP